MVEFLTILGAAFFIIVFIVYGGGLLWHFIKYNVLGFHKDEEDEN